MLRFRPIAPKPAGADWVPAKTEEFQRRNAGDVAASGGKRMKRKYVRVLRRRCCRRKEAETTSSADKSAVESESSPAKKVVATLQLLPVVAGHKNSRKELNFFTPQNNNSNDVIANSQKSSSRVASCVDQSWVVVECVTEIFTEFGKLGFSDDKEKIKGLEVDTCPGFVSDGGNNVVWVNDAYRKMGGSYSNELTVRLVVKETLPQFCPSFACRATLIQRTWRGQKWNRIFHCDVWKMCKFEGFAWRMDLDTSIGLGC